MSSSSDDVLSSLFRMPRFGPSLFATLITGILLLFLKDLSEEVINYLIPSLVIYIIGTSLLGTLHRLLGLHYEKAEFWNNEKPIPVAWRISLLVIHLLWFSGLIVYNFWRGVL